MTELWTPIPDTHEMVERADLVDRLVAYGQKRTGANTRASTGKGTVMYYDASADTIETAAHRDSAIPGVFLREGSWGNVPHETVIFGESPDTRDAVAVLLPDRKEAGVETRVQSGNWIQPVQLLRQAASGGFEANLDNPHVTTFTTILDEFLRSAGVEYRPNGQSTIVRPEWLGL